MGPGEGRARAAEVHQGDAARHRGEDQPRAARQRGDPHEEPARQVSCDWWRAGHVTTVLTSDWSSGVSGWWSLEKPDTRRQKDRGEIRLSVTLSSDKVSCDWWPEVT